MVPGWVKGALVLAVTLAAGVVIGVGYERHRPTRHEAGMDAHHLLRRFGAELELDPPQQQAVAAILARHQGAVDSTWHSVQPHVHAMMDSTLREILSVLRPDQAVKFRKLMEQMHPGMVH